MKTVTTDDPLAQWPGLRFPPDREAVRVSEVAGKLEVSQQHVVDWIENGVIPAHRAEGGGKSKRGCYRIAVKDYEAFIISRLYPRTSQ